MACIDCNKDGCKWNTFMPCGVCVLNNNDSTPKWTCYCGLCESYICKKHWNDPIARTLAAAKKIVKKVRNVLKKKKDGEPAAVIA